MRTHRTPETTAPEKKSSGSANSLAPPVFQLKADNAVMQRQVAPYTCGVSSPRWEEFAGEFNTNFASIKHIFAGESEKAGTEKKAPEKNYSEAPPVSEEPLSSQMPENSEPNMSVDPSQAPLGETPVAEPLQSTEAKEKENSDQWITGEALSCLFTNEQREMLMDYFNTNVIPDRLFNGDEIGGTSAQQRILMSGVILAKGEYTPGSFSQRLHARFCGHWVKLVWHYAGVTPTGNMEWAGVSGNLDHDGNILIGNGKQESVFSGRKSRTYLDKAGEKERDALTPDGTSFTSAYEGASEERKKSFQRYGELPIDEAVAKIEPGDWLYYFNGNASASGNHSVIFSHWDGPTKVSPVSGVRYRRAIVFSQGRTSTGGKEHSVNLGDQFQSSDSSTKQPKICTVTNITRVDENAGPADSVEDVLGGTMSEGPELSRTNQTYQKRFTRRHKTPIDLDLLRKDLREENKALIDELAALDGDRLTDGQEALLRAANEEENVENLVRLTRRLRALTTSVRKHDQNIEQKYETGRPAIKGKRRGVPGLNEQYETIREESEAKLEAIEIELAELEEEMGPLQNEIDNLEDEINELGNKAEIKELRGKLNASWVELKKYKPRSPERKAIMKERKEMIARKKELQVEAKGNKSDVSAMEKQLRPLKRQIRPLERQKARLEKKKAEVNAKDPYGLAHTGNNKTGVDKTYKFKSDIEAVRPYRKSGYLKSQKKEEKE